MTIKITF